MTMANNTAAQTEMPVFYLKEEHHPETGTMLGFWIYLMSDCLIFGILFATYAVIGQNCHRHAIKPRKAADQRLAIEFLELMEFGAIDKTGDDFAGIIGLAYILRDEAV